MKVGVVGPTSWSERIAEFRASVDVQWGTDSLPRVRELLASGQPVDGVIVEASPEYVTSELVRCLSESNTPGFALVSGQENTEWIDAVEGITRIAELTDLTSAGVLARPTETSVPPTSSVALDERASTAGHKTCRVIAVWGPTGAPGASTVAIGLAVIAAREGNTVFLCDADTRGAAIAIGMGLIDDVPGFAAACRLAGRGELTADEIERLSVIPDGFAGRLSVLTGLPRASRWAEVAGAKATLVLEQLRTQADVVVIDVGFGIEENEWVDGAPQRDGAARALIRAADHVVAVGLADAVGIARLIRGLDEVTELCADPVVVLNQTTRLTATDARDAISRFTHHRVSAVIARDGRGGLDDASSRALSSVKPVWTALGGSLAKRVRAPKR